MPPSIVTLDLTRDEFDTLLLCMGYAAGAARQQEDTTLAASFLRLANAVNRGNPQWTPYAIPGDSEDFPVMWDVLGKMMELIASAKRAP
jgi:hypothetical protein